MCSGAPRLPIGRHPLAGGGMSLSTQLPVGFYISLIFVEIVLRIANTEIVGKALGDIIRNIERQIVPKIFHLPAVLLCRTSCSPVTLEDECLDRSTEFCQFFRWSEILRIFRYKLGTLTLINKLKYLVGISDSAFACNYRITDLH